jgi:hypothetical protein
MAKSPTRPPTRDSISPTAGCRGWTVPCGRDSRLGTPITQPNPKPRDAKPRAMGTRYGQNRFRRPEIPAWFRLCTRHEKDHGGAHVAVAVEILDGANVVAVLQHVGGKGMRRVRGVTGFGGIRILACKGLRRSKGALVAQVVAGVAARMLLQVVLMVALGRIESRGRLDLRDHLGRPLAGIVDLGLH